MTKKKSRESIPSEVAARVLFLSDRQVPVTSEVTGTWAPEGI